MPRQLIDPSTGQLHDVPDENVAGALAAGWHPEGSEDTVRIATTAANELNYGGVSGGIKAGLAGIARGATLGASDVAARIFGGEDAARSLQGLQAQNPYLSGAGEFAGMLLPAVVTGGAATPAGIASKIGRGATAGLTREGAGLVERTAAHAAGAAVEGSLYGGGQYLSQAALENKPLSAEGFVGGMGRGALFAAPVGGGFALAGEGLRRARTLFPRAQLTPEAAAVVKGDATSALQSSLADGDAMADRLRQRIAVADAQAGAAGARTQVTRLAFGGGDPAALGAQVDATASKAQLTDALARLEASQQSMKEWIAAGGDAALTDPDVERVMGSLVARPDTLGPGGVPVGEFGKPGARGVKSPEELAAKAAGEGSEPRFAGGTPGAEPPATRVLRGTAGPEVATRGGAAAEGRPASASPLDDIAPSTPGAELPVASLDDIRPAAPGTAVGKRPPRASAPFSDTELDSMQGNAPWGQATSAKLQGWSGNDVFIGLNRGLRDGTASATQRKLADDISSALERSPSPRDATVYRWITGRPGGEGSAERLYAKLKTGDVFEEKGFSATTTDEKIARREARAVTGRPSGVVLRIDAPRGTPLGAVPSEFGATEKELLMPHGSRFRVTRVAIGDDGIRTIDVAVEPRAKLSAVGPLEPATAVGKRPAAVAQEIGAAREPTSFTITDRAAGGTQGGRWYADEHGQQWFGKHYGGSTDRVEGEHLANQVYRMFGVDAPETRIATVGGKRMLMSREAPGRVATSAEDIAATNAKDGFVIDAWLANHDVVGTGYDNILVSGPKAVRIDNGGATIWRAQGESKAFRALVGELDSMRDPSRYAGKAFANLTPAEVDQQVQRFAAEYPAKKTAIDQLVDGSGLSRTAKEQIKSGLHDRATWLIDRAKGAPAELADGEFSRLADAAQARLPEPQRQTAMAYTRQGLYAQLNAPLREMQGKAGGGGLKPVAEHLHDVVRRLDDAVASSPAPRDMVVSRGVNGRRSTAALSKLQPGDVYVDPGFVSTSYSSEIGGDYAKGFDVRPGVELKISVPKGYPALAIPSEFPKEREILLGRGGRFIVTGREVAADGRVTLRMALREPDAFEAAKLPEGFAAKATDSRGNPMFSDTPDVAFGIPEAEDIPSAAHSRNVAYIVKPSELAERGVIGKSKGPAGPWNGSLDLPAIEVSVHRTYAEATGGYKTAGYTVDDGVKRLLAAAADGDRPVLVRFFPSARKIEAVGGEPLADDIRKAIGREAKLTGPPAEPLHPLDVKRAAEAAADSRHPLDVLRDTREAAETPDQIFARHKVMPRFEDIAAGDGRPDRVYLHLSSPEGDGVMLVHREDGRFVIGRDSIPKELRGQGVGTAMYEKMNGYLESKYGQPLVSDVAGSRSHAAEALWERLEQRGLARREGAAPGGRPERWVMAASAPPADDLLAALAGTKAALDKGESFTSVGRAPAAASRAEQQARSAAAAEHFRARALEARPFEGPVQEGPAADAKLGDLLPASPRAADPLAAAREAGKGRSLEDFNAMLGIGPGMKIAAADLEAALNRGFASEAPTAVDKGLRAKMRDVADNAAIERLLQHRTGKNVDMGPALERAAEVIGDHEAASADAVELLGADAPKTAADRSRLLRQARQAQAESQAASAAKAAQGIQDRGVPALGDRTVVDPGVGDRMRALRGGSGPGDRTVVDPTIGEAMKQARGPAAAGSSGLGGKLADVGTALEVMKALGVHVPALSAIPVIGPVLGLFFKARAVLSILGRKGGSIGRSAEGSIAGISAATQDRIARATQAILTGAGKGAIKLSEISAGPAATLGYRLFPGDGVTKSKDPQKLAAARLDEIARAQQPGAIDHAIADRYPTADPDLHDAIVGQVQRGIAFLDSKAPKPSILQTMLPGDGTWTPSKAQLDEFGKYVHAVGDPASVLEDLAKGHVTLEGAETLRVVYPELFALGQKMLLQAAPEMRKTLPYPTRVAISILYRIPVDGTMQPGHLQYLQGQGSAASGPSGLVGGPTGAAPPVGPPMITGPIRLGQNTMTALDRRAGS